MTESLRYLCFHLAKEEFAIPLLSIKEVIGFPEITAVPQSPSHFLGIMNLRGQVISVMDLRLKLGIKAGKTDETSVVILDLGDHQLGVVVDQVNSVLLLGGEEISDRPGIDNSKAFDYITGVFRKNEKLIFVLDIARALSVEDRSTFAKNNSNVA